MHGHMNIKFTYRYYSMESRLYTFTVMRKSDLTYWAIMKNVPDRNLSNSSCSIKSKFINIQIIVARYKQFKQCQCAGLFFFFFSMDLRFSSQIIPTVVFLSYADKCEAAACTKRLLLLSMSCTSCHS